MDQTGGYIDFPFVAEFYDTIPLYQDRDDVGFFVDSAVESGGPVLELGCGTGRVLIPTARIGIDIVGVDLSENMLDLCRKKLRAEQPEVQARAELLCDDMSTFDLGREFALATIPFRPFQHLETLDDQLACLHNIHRHLKPGGRLILDLFNPSLPIISDQSHSKEWGDEPEFTTPDGRRVMRRMRIAERDYFNQISICEIIYYVTYPNGRKERLVHTFKMKYLFRFEAEHLLYRCGFEVEALYSDYKRSPYGKTYPGELVFVARKV